MNNSQNMNNLVEIQKNKCIIELQTGMLSAELQVCTGQKCVCTCVCMQVSVCVCVYWAQGGNPTWGGAEFQGSMV